MSHNLKTTRPPRTRANGYYPPLLLTAFALLLVLVFFGPAMMGFQRLAFRDVGHFYPPLYQFIGDADSWFPLWNPFDHTGIPVAGETTTALFYPPRFLFSLGLPTSVAMAWFVAVHFVLAALGSTWVARTLGCDRNASLIAGIVYAFSGPVLFLYCNPPFLVGAAWLPFALGGALRLADGWSAANLLMATCGLAMSTLGGDPQTTVHVGLIVGGTLLWRQVRYSGSRWIKERSSAPVRRTPCWSPVILAAVLAGVIAAPQIAAALDWSRHSARRYEPPPGVTRLLADTERGAEQRWWQPPPVDSHAADIYAFSIAPWHWFDLLVPKLSGELFPEYQRLSALLLDDGRVWTVTLYLGLLPLLAIFARYMRSPNQSDWRHLDVWDMLIPVGVLMSLGAFGPIWFWKTVSQAVGITALDSVDDALFSPYWTAVTSIPGYSAFRYPAKWLPVVMLGCGVATARVLSHLDEATRTKMRRAAKGLAWTGVVSAMTAGVLLFWPNRLQALGATVPPDPFWGPLNVESAVGSVFFSGVHVFFCAVIASYLLGTRGNWRPSTRLAALGGLLAIDLLVSGYSQVAAIDRRAEQRFLHELGRREDSLQPFDRLIRTRIGSGWPTAWSRSCNPHRLLEVETSGRHALFGRWHLARSLGALNSATSIDPQRAKTFWRAAREYAERLPVEQRIAFWTAVARVLAVDAFVSRNEQDVVKTDGNDIPLHFVDRGVQRIDDPLPKIRWHDRWEIISPQNYVSEQAWDRLLARWHRAGNQSVPVVETDDPIDRFASSAAEESATGEVADAVIRVRDEGLSGTEIEVMAPGRGLLVLSRYQDDHWQAHVRQGQAAWQQVTVHPVDHLGQGIILPGGHWHVRIRYRPPWFVPSLVISAAGVAGIAAWCVALRRREKCLLLGR